MNRIIVKSVEIREKSLAVEYALEGAPALYLSGERFECSFSEDVGDTPESVAVIPFLCDVLPVAWLTDATIEVSAVDRQFLESIEKFKRGYVSQYPMLNFAETKIRCGNIQNNAYEPSENCAAFFSGGVDAFCTLISHIEEKPRLITLWGSDVTFDDLEGWRLVEKHAKDTAEQFALPVPVSVKTNFRALTKDGALNKLVAKSGDSWWHGFQHGIGIIGHAAPVAYKYKMNVVYIASSYTKETQRSCASHPEIDSNVRLAGTRVWHDQYEKSRQKKVRTIVDFCNRTNHRVFLRVCYESKGGKNCCRCEKCYRTIFALLALGADPREYGFDYSESELSRSKKIVSEALLNSTPSTPLWKEIQDDFVLGNACKSNPAINWIYTIDVFKKRSFASRVCRWGKYRVKSLFVKVLPASFKRLLKSFFPER